MFTLDSSECLYCDFLGYDTVYSGRWVLVCRRNAEGDSSDTVVTPYQATRCYMTQNYGRNRWIFSDNKWLLKAKLSLFLIKQTLWKYMGRGGTTPRFLNLDIRWRWLHVPGRFILGERDFGYRSKGTFFGGGSRPGVRTHEKGNVFFMLHYTYDLTAIQPLA
jgi:hypothetical protein